MNETKKTLLNLGLTALVSAGTGLVVSELSKGSEDRSASVGGNVDTETLKAQLKEALYNEWLNDPIIQNRLRGPRGPQGEIGNDGVTNLANSVFSEGILSINPFTQGGENYSFLNLKSNDNTAFRVINNNSVFKIEKLSSTFVATELMRVLGDGTISKIGGGSFAALSDERVKDNIEDFANGLAKILAIQTKTFKYKKVAGTQTEFYPDFICEKTQYGVIAQQLREVCPEMVTEGEDGFLSVDLSNLNLMLVNAVKELDKKDKAQQTTINQYKTRIESLEASLQTVLGRLEALEAPQA